MRRAIGIGDWGLGIGKNGAQAESSLRVSNLQPPTPSPQPFLSNPQPPTPNLHSAASRRGITLLEVLISMGVLLIGLMGVGAMIPAGRFEIKQGVKTDYGTTVGRAAFRELKARGYLNPRSWATGAAVPVAVWQPAADPNRPFNTSGAATAQPAVAIDPLGITASAGSFGQVFPSGAGVPFLARITLYQSPSSVMSGNVADTIFRCTDDLITVPNTAIKDGPPIQQTVPYGSVAPNIMTRASEGNYSWLATVATDPTSSALSSKVIVSVVTFYKRDLSNPATSESYATVLFPTPGVWTSEIILTAPVRLVRPGQWLMLAGNLSVPDPAPPYPFIQATVCRWYRVVGAAPLDPSTGNQSVTLAGPDWSMAATNPTAWMFEGIISVYEKNMRLEIE